MYIFSTIVFIFTIHSFLKPKLFPIENNSVLKEPLGSNETKSLLTTIDLKSKRYLFLQSISKQNMRKYHEFIINRFLKLNSPELINQ